MSDFLQNLKSLETFYLESQNLYGFWEKNTGSLFLSPDMVQNVSIELVSKRKINEDYLKRSVLILICVIWEVFIKEVQENNPSLKTVLAGWNGWGTPEMKEIILIRDLFIHKKGKADAIYMKLSSNPNLYELGQDIVLNDNQLTLYFIDARKSFNMIMRLSDISN